MAGRSTTWIFAILSASLAAGYGVLFTVVGDFRDEYGISETQIGVVIGIGFLSAFFSQILIAPRADQGYAQHLIVVGVLANVVGLVMMAFGESLGPILAGRIVSGIGVGTAIPAIRRIVILADPDNLGHNLGLLFSADVFGFAMGPAVSAVLVGPFGLAAPFLVVATATAVLAPFAYTVTFEEPESPTRQRLAVDLLRSRVVAGAVVLGGAAFLMIGAFDSLWDVVHEDLETVTWMANLGITLFAIPLVILGPYAGRLAQRVGPFRVGAAGLFIASGFMFLYGQLPTGGWIFAVTMVHAITDGLTFAAAGVAIAMAVPEERQAGAQGLMGAAEALVAGVAAIAIGGIYDAAGRATAYGVAAVGMLVLVSTAIALAMPFIKGDRPHAVDEVTVGPGTDPIIP